MPRFPEKIWDETEEEKPNNFPGGPKPASACSSIGACALLPVMSGLKAERISDEEYQSILKF